MNTINTMDIFNMVWIFIYFNYIDILVIYTIYQYIVNKKMFVSALTNFNWKCKHTWKKSAHNTKWCLIGCAIGDLGTIYYFQINEIAWPTLNIMILAIINGLITSIILETIILLRQSFSLRNAISTALGMSFISMISMEIAMNVTDVILTGGAMLTWWVVPIMLFVGFITPWPYNYWRLKKYNIACH